MSDVSGRMKMRPLRVVLAGLVLLAMFCLAWNPVSAQGQTGKTSISGRVIKGTEGGASPEGMQMILLTIDEAAQRSISTTTTTVNANGEFSFDGLTPSPNVVYRVVANSGEFTPSVDLREADDWSNVELTVYDETQSLENISFLSYTMMVPEIDRRNRLAGVLVVVDGVNRGDTTWAPDLEAESFSMPNLLRFNLPEGFNGLVVDTNLPPGGNLIEVPTGVAMTNPIPPGDFQVILQYLADYDGDTLAFPLRLPYGAEMVRIIVPAGETSVSGLGLVEEGESDFEGTTYNMARGTGYGRDAQLDVSISGLPEPTFLQGAANFFDGRSYMLVIVWVAGAAMLTLLGFAFFATRRRASAPAPALAGGSMDAMTIDAGDDRQRIIQEIADLDARHEAGDIGDDDYAARREALKQQALKSAKPVRDV